jgi:hypothetical protein
MSARPRAIAPVRCGARATALGLSVPRLAPGPSIRCWKRPRRCASLERATLTRGCAGLRRSAIHVGWQDRDWAKWTDEERTRYVGGATAPVRASTQTYGSRRGEITLLAMLVSLGASLMIWHLHFLNFAAGTPSPALVVPTSPVVYGTGLADMTGASEEMTCTATATDARGAESCTSWTILSSGQHAVQAAPLSTGINCASAEADQQSGRWICVAPAPPATPSPGS